MMTWAWKVLPLCMLWLCSVSEALRLGAQDGLGNDELENKPFVKVQGMKIIGRDWSDTDRGEVITFFDVRYAPGACPNCTQPRYSYSDSSRWKEGLSSPILADGPYPRKICPQKESFTAMIRPPDYESTEDCLHLDIYAPKKAILGRQKSKRNVLVFIHGGAGYSGDKSETSWFNYAAEGYKGLAERERPIVVNINYRLEPFSSIRHPELEPAQWNLWLLDCIEALKWVKDHIGRFGGDKSKVTIMGQSYGAHLVGYLTRAKPARGLFRRAIPISGFSMGKYSISPTDESATDGLAEWYNETFGGKSIFDVSADEIVQHADDYPFSFLNDKWGNFTIPGQYFDEDVIPPYVEKDMGRDDKKDVPLFVMNEDTEQYAQPIGLFLPPDEPYTTAASRAFSDRQFQGMPLYTWCLRDRLEELELKHGADPDKAIFRAYQTAYPVDLGWESSYFAGRSNVWTARIINPAYKVCHKDIHNPLSGLVPNHGAELLGMVPDLTPWAKLMNATPEELIAGLDSGNFAPIGCETLKSQKHALEIGFVNETTSNMIRKAIIDFTLYGNPGWENDQVAMIEPTSDGKPKLVSAFSESTNLTQAFLTKCTPECHFASGPSVPPSQEICKPIIQNVECAC